MPTYNMQPDIVQILLGYFCLANTWFALIVAVEAKGKILSECLY